MLRIYKIATIIFAISFLVSTSLYLNEIRINADISFDLISGNHWACMDGCYNMLEVIYGEVDNDNKTLKDYHTVCSDICFNQYFAFGGLDE